VSGISFAIGRRETLALVGESGSGTSTVARMVVGCCGPRPGGDHSTASTLWAPARVAERQTLRRRLQMIFQESLRQPQSALAVDRIIADPIKASELAKDKARWSIAWPSS
jgi:peptide/nickel transport system ATP-binding protein